VSPAGRVLLWLGVAAFLASTLFAAIASGEPTGILGFAGFPIVGAIILSSQPRNGLGWVLYAIGLMWVLSAPVSNLPVMSVVEPPVEAVGVALGWPGWGAIPLIGLLFPTGRIENRAGRILAGLLIGYVALATVMSVVAPGPLGITQRPNPLGVDALDTVADIVLGPVGSVFFVSVIVGIIVDLAIRWRRSVGTARLQYRWLVFSLAVVVIVVAISGLLNQVYRGEEWVLYVSMVLGAVTNLIPISIGIAITRHGLYEIGRVVSRTVAFAVVTLVVVGVYAGVVTSVSLLLPQQSTIAVAVATLIAAAVFLPVLRRVQRAVERRFDRERYDAQKVVEEFGGHLRTAVDPDATAPDLVAAVERTLQPRSVGVWARGGAR